jgi:hypothetical protein
MKKFLPFVFPLIALVIVLFLGYRWYTARIVRSEDKLPQVGEGMKIEDLSSEEADQLKNSAKDMKSVDLKGESGTQGAGQIRYDIKDGKVVFSISADLPELVEGQYQVWIKTGNDQPKRAFVLEMTKAGYIGTAAISADTLPAEVTISEEKKQDDTVEKVVLKGILPKAE